MKVLTKNLPKKGQFADLRSGGEGVWRKRGGGIFEDRLHAMTLPDQLYPKQVKFFQTMTA